ncbi:MAG: AbrB/MazE/SpoVT family DNA-binding domain-containing protein [Planctomycetes bacterium]|nr:AbrB/MazE/SpoVT family DNA-binding domain-containing protein [Planctomycetota bacterium]MBU4478387.1 AbrB/MazE/SpoVT family DNA-binding domain-containing protein [Candidatus Omnitrophota bacterium]
MITTKVSEKYRITLPPEARQKLHIEVGDFIEVRVTDTGIVLMPKRLIDSSQVWFWSKEWQQAEKEVEAEYKSGKYKTAKNVKEFLTELHHED